MTKKNATKKTLQNRLAEAKTEEDRLLKLSKATDKEIDGLQRQLTKTDQQLYKAEDKVYELQEKIQVEKEKVVAKKVKK